MCMKHNIVASIAVFQSLYNNKQDIYSILSQFIVATINEKNLWTFCELPLFRTA